MPRPQCTNSISLCEDGSFSVTRESSGGRLNEMDGCFLRFTPIWKNKIRWWSAQVIKQIYTSRFLYIDSWLMTIFGFCSACKEYKLGLYLYIMLWPSVCLHGSFVAWSYAMIDEWSSSFNWLVKLSSYIFSVVAATAYETWRLCFQNFSALFYPFVSLSIGSCGTTLCTST